MSETKECAKCGDDLSPKSEEELCSDCKQEEIEANEIDTVDKDYPTCPHCGNEDHDWCEGTLTEDGDVEWHRCHRCQKSYKVTMHIVATFTTEKFGGDER
ncbi:hypothetical protein CIG75_19175 [Tumebacillus algifaecis]|uniref:Uncharacterized protein n=1 Tax=Tumebacillus algifaecis TaxID=1214604 RepID=A0A223D617_9BACL|nr:hypothetical protein CIG75_19175 [Tumebacillus algifaecis]